MPRVAMRSGAGEEGAEFDGAPLAGDLGFVEPAVVENGTCAGEEQAGGAAKGAHAHDGERSGGLVEEGEETGDVGGGFSCGGNFHDVGPPVAGAGGEGAESRESGGGEEVVMGQDEGFSGAVGGGDDFAEGAEGFNFEVHGGGGWEEFEVEGEAGGIGQGTGAAFIEPTDGKDNGMGEDGKFRRQGRAGEDVHPHFHGIEIGALGLLESCLRVDDADHVCTG